MSPGAKWAIGGAIAGGSVASLLGAGSSALAVYFARRVITPARQRTADKEVLAVIRDGQEQQVILAANDDTTVDGVYGFFFETKTWIRVVLFIATIPIAIVANASRVTMTGLLWEYKKELAEGFFHSAEGWVIFMVALTALLVFHQVLKIGVRMVEAKRG